MVAPSSVIVGCSQRQKSMIPKLILVELWKISLQNGRTVLHDYEPDVLVWTVVFKVEPCDMLDS